MPNALAAIPNRPMPTTTRGDILLVDDDPDLLKLISLRLTSAGYRVRTMRAKDATMMRIEAPKGLVVSAESHETSWTIRLAQTALKPHRFLKPERKGGRIETMLVSAAGLVWFEDPVVGDLIAAAVSYGPSSASPTPRAGIRSGSSASRPDRRRSSSPCPASTSG